MSTPNLAVCFGLFGPAHNIGGIHMQKTTAIAMFAALAAAAMIPAASAELLARDFADVVVGVDFGSGLGLYNPTPPADYCAALQYDYLGVSPVSFYYTGVRYFPGAAASV